MKFALVAGLLCALIAGPASAQAPKADKAPDAKAAKPALRDPFADAREALADRDYAKAVALLDAHLARKDASAEEALYLKGNAQFLNKQPEQAIAALQSLLKAHPATVWRRKAVFKIADCHVAKTPPDYAAAARVFEQEVAVLVGPERKLEIAAIYLKFADEAFAPTAKDPTGRLKEPDYGTAVKFYDLAREVGLADAVRDQVEFRLGVCAARTGDGGAIERLKRYRKEFAKTGRFLPEAEYTLGEAFLQVGDAAGARAAWRDLAERAAKPDANLPEARRREIAELAAFALFFVSRTHDREGVLGLSDDGRGGDDGGRLHNVQAAVEQLRARRDVPEDQAVRESHAAFVKAHRDFLTRFPQHALAPQAKYEIALASFNIDRNAEATAALAAFVAEYERAGEAEFLSDARLIARRHGRPDSPPQARMFLMPLARLHLGRALAAQKKFTEAVDVWQAFLTRHPADALWTEVQQAILDAEFAVGADLLAAKKPAEARTAWEKFIGRYPLDARVPGLYFTFGQIRFDEKRYDEALADWRLVAGKFPNADESRRAQYRIALTLETKLDKPAEAIEEYRKLVPVDNNNGGGDLWGARARQRITLMTQRELQVSTERSFRTDEKAVVKVFSRNVEKLQVRFYKLDLSSFFRKQHTVLGVEYLDLSLIEPTSKWEHVVKGYAKFKPAEDAIEVPIDGPGAAAVTISDGTLAATTLVLRSDLDILIKSGRSEMLVYAQNMRTGEPFAKVDILVGDGKQIVVAGSTNADGVLRWKDKKLAESNNLAVFAVSGGHLAANAVALAGLRPPEGLPATAHIYTDRPAYRPGQTVNIRAVVREVKDGSYSFTAGQEWSLDVADPAGRVLRSERIKLSAFGTLHTRFLLDEGAPLGGYRVVVRRENGPTFAGGFAAARYQLPKVQLKFEIPEPVYFRGETVKGKIVARYYYGEPFAGRELVYHLGDGQSRTAKTDAKGEITFEIDTKPYSESAVLSLSAAFPEENVAASDTVVIATQGFSIALSTVRDVYLTDEKFDVAITVNDGKGKPMAQALKASLIRLEPRGGSAAGGGGGAAGGTGEIVVATREATTDAKTGKATVNFAADKGGRHVVHVEGTDRFGNIITRRRAVLISGDDDATKLRIISDTQTFKVGENREIGVHSRLAKRKALVTYEGEGVIDYELVNLLPGLNKLRLAVDHRHFPNFAAGVAVLEPGKLYQARFEFAVERELKIALKPATSTPAPGSPLDVDIEVTDQAGRPVQAELSVALVDASLKALFGDGSGAVTAVFAGRPRQAHMRTAASTTFAYHPATERVNELVAAEAVRVDRVARMAQQVEMLRGELRAQVNEIRGREDLARLRRLAVQFVQIAKVGGGNGEMPAAEGEEGWFAGFALPADIEEQIGREFSDVDNPAARLAAALSMRALAGTDLEAGKVPWFNEVQLLNLFNSSGGDGQAGPGAGIFRPDAETENAERLNSALNQIQRNLSVARQEVLSEERLSFQELRDQREVTRQQLDLANSNNDEVMFMRQGRGRGQGQSAGGGGQAGPGQAIFQQQQGQSFAGRGNAPPNAPRSVQERFKMEAENLGRQPAAKSVPRNGEAKKSDDRVDRLERSVKKAESDASDIGAVLAGIRAAPVAGGEVFAQLADPSKPARDFFPETGYWNPAVVTDKAGKARVRIELPDSITRWELLARGVDAATVVGSAESEITAKKEFFVELRTPPVLAAGDRMKVSARVHHLAELKAGAKSRAVKLTLAVVSGGVRQEENIALDFTGKEVREVSFSAYPAGAGRLSLTLTAAADDGLKDAIVREIPVRPTGQRLVAFDSATTRNSATVFVELPKGRQYANPQLTVVVGPGIVRTLVDTALNIQPRLVGVRRPAGGPGADPYSYEFVRVPADGVSTAAGDLLAVVFVSNYLKGGQRSADQIELESRLATLTAGLVTAQNADGGWSWCGGNQASDPYVSARVGWALASARESGHAVDPKTLERARAYLDAEFAKAAETDLNTKAVLLHALTEISPAGGDRFAQANRLYRMRNTLSTAALAYLSLTFSGLDRKGTAGEINELLQTRKRAVADPIGPGSAFWPAVGAHAYLSADVEVTALAVLAIQRVNPRDPTVAAGVRWLTSQRRGMRCVPDKATGLVVASLGSFHLITKPAADKYRMTVLVNDREIGRMEVEAEARTLRFDAPAEVIQAAARNKVELRLEGNAEYNYAVTLSGFAAGEDVDLSGGRLNVTRRVEPAPLEHNGRSIPRGFTTLTGTFTPWANTLDNLPAGKAAHVALTIVRNTKDVPGAEFDYVVVHEPIPAGCAVAPDSVRGTFERHEIGDGEIVFYVGRRSTGTVLRYTLLGMLAGEYTAGPPVAASLYRPGVMRVGVSRKLSVLGRDSKSPDPYRMSPDELYHLGARLFEDGDYKQAAAHLSQLFNDFNTPSYSLRDDTYKETARMLLRAAIESKDNDGIVRFFEVLKERYPDLVVPYDQVLTIGRAYLAKGEFERGLIVFRATADAGFVTEAQAAQVLRSQGRFAASVDFLRALLMQYPDTPATQSAAFALSQLLYDASRKPEQFADLKEKKTTKAELLADAVRLIREFLSLHPTNPQADEAGYSMAAAFLELEDFASAAKLARTLPLRHPQSTMLDGFLYMHAYCSYALGEYERAVADCRSVAEGKFRNRTGAVTISEHRHLATYIIGQVHHSRLEPAKAIEFYEKVSGRFADAKEAIEHFTRKSLTLDEVKAFVPRPIAGALPDGADAVKAEAAAKSIPHVRLAYSNIAEADVKVYRVDLMKLYLMQRSLSGITAVHLAGITPTFEQTVKLGDGKDYAKKSRYVWLPQIATTPGAYLVVVRGEDLHRSGLVLVGSLRLEVQEDALAGRVRVNVRNEADGKYAPKVHVKVLGEGNPKPEAGETDLRGIVVADDVRGRAAVLAQFQDQYAFHRGTADLQNWSARRAQPQAAPARVPEAKPRTAGSGKTDYLGAVRADNFRILDRNKLMIEKEVFGRDQKGVQVQYTK